MRGFASCDASALTCVRRKRSPLEVSRGYLMVVIASLFVTVDVCTSVAKILDKTDSMTARQRNCLKK